MTPYIAPNALRVNEEPSPCTCIETPTRLVICEFCVQANLILWEKEHDIGKIRQGLIPKIREYGVRKLARDLFVSPGLVGQWVSGKRPISLRQIEKIKAKVFTCA